MSVGRIVGTAAAIVTVGGCAIAVVGLARADVAKHHPIAERGRADTASSSSPAQLPGATRSRSRRVVHHRQLVTRAAQSVTSVAPSTTAATSVRPTPTHTYKAAPTPTSTPTPTPTYRPRPTPTPVTTTHSVAPTVRPKPAPQKRAPQRGVRLPVSGTTGSATRVLTVKARSTSATVASLQAWRKAPGGGWLKVGSAVTAHIGADGMSRSPSESRSATPIGSFTLTQAFGHDANPGTQLPYIHTTPADWWISQSGSLYNTHQRCSSGCRFNQGSPNEHLYYETPYYDYAVVIDYNTRNAPGGVHQGAGSAFFLHVYPPGTGPTAGCVAIPVARLTPIMRWLLPNRHPRILIGTG
jgi:L,D-peptidoglycan transpeptidase YkuD (ErfK/YbiS/YcfS/YnhG family)